MRTHGLGISALLAACILWAVPAALGQADRLCDENWATWLGFCTDTGCKAAGGKCVALDTGGWPWPDTCLCKIVIWACSMEPPDVIGSPGGTVLTGQVGFYIPAGTTSTDFMAYTYMGNALGIKEFPHGFGDDQFVAGIGPAGNVYARAQVDIPLAEDRYLFIYDLAVVYLGGPPSANNIGSFSLQPSTSRRFIHLGSWVDPNNPVSWNAYYTVYDAAGVSLGYLAPGPEWSELELNRWYRFMTEVDFASNKFVWVHIGELEGEVAGSVYPDEWYLNGGAGGGGLPLPEAFRLFAGGGVPGNTLAADNIQIVEIGVEEPCPGDFDCDGDRDFDDIDPFVEALSTGQCKCPDPKNCDPNGDGLINFDDIDPFIPLIGVPCP